jgi:hypothetical protein
LKNPILSADRKTLKMLNLKGHQVASLNFEKKIKLQQELITFLENNKKKTKQNGNVKTLKKALKTPPTLTQTPSRQRSLK